MLKRFGVRALSLLIAVVFCAALLCPLASVSADSKSFSLLQGNIVIGADGDGLYVSVADKRTGVSADTQIVIDGAHTSTKNTISVRDNVKANITLDGVRIESSGFLKAPFELCGAENVRLTLKGSNTLTAPGYMAALQVNRYAKLSIVGDGSLTARGGTKAAGIGGGWKSGIAGASCGDITIGENVRISAYGGDFGAAVGGGEGGASGAITIEGYAAVYALGGKNAAGIGSGSQARSRGITITSSSTVEAAGGEGGAGIGSGKGASASKITISGSANVRAGGSAGGAGIGSGQGGNATLIALSDSCTVRARGGEGAAGIGAGKDAPLSVGVSVNGFSSVYALGGKEAAGIGGSNLSGGNLTFSDSVLIEAFGGAGGAGIGGGKSGTVNDISISGRSSVYAYGGKNAAGIGSGDSGVYHKISLFGNASIYSIGGKFGAGVGGGKLATCGEMRIYGSCVVTAQGGNFGAGIGTGAKNAPDYAPTAGTIYIYGDASVRAAGGKDASGVGGGLYAAGGKVVVSDTAALDAYRDLTVTPNNSSTEKKADYTIVEAALAKVPKDLSDYTEESVEILQIAINEIVYDLPASQQAHVDNYAASLERAISILTKKTIERTLTLSKTTFESGEPITIKWKGATSPNDRVVVLMRDRLPSDTEINPDLEIPYGSILLSRRCVDGYGKLAKSGTTKLSLSDSSLLYGLGYRGLPEGKYTAYLLLEDDETPAAKVNFAVSGTAMMETELADYTAINEALALIPADSTLYTPDSWQILSDLCVNIPVDLPKTDQAIVDGYAKSLRDAIAALVPVSQNPDPAATGLSAEALPGGEGAPLAVSSLTSLQNEPFELRLLAKSAGKPEQFGWGLISMQPTNVETVGRDSVVSAINYAPEAADIAIDESDNFDTMKIAASNIGAGAGCTMMGSFQMADTAFFNGTVTSATVTLQYGASIGTLAFDHIAGESFTLPDKISCPGYIFQGWSSDEKGTSPASGSFDVTGDLTFYANWEVVPVSIEKNFAFSSGALGLEYSDHLRLQNASSNFTVSLSKGDLPNGLSLDPESGAIFGTPTDLGTFNFTLLIVDANGTRTENDYFITIYHPIQMTFEFFTSANEHAGTTGEISFYYSYHDLGNGQLKESAPIHLTELLSTNPNALQPGQTDKLTLTVGAFVGEPSQLFFENSSAEDGYRIDKVLISTEGNEDLNAFEKTYQINAWVGHIDEADFMESGTLTILIVLLVIFLIIIGVLVFLRLRHKFPLFGAKKDEKSDDAKSAPTPKKEGNAPNLPRAPKAPEPTANPPQRATRPTGAAPRPSRPRAATPPKKPPAKRPTPPSDKEPRL